MDNQKNRDRREDPGTPPPAGVDLARAERVYTRLRRRIDGWLRRRGRAGEAAAPYLLLLPDLFALILRLVRDPRVGRGAKLHLLAVTAYVISPIDLVPDFLLPLGLIDDTVAVALVLSRVVNVIDEAGEEVLREHWEGPGDILETIRRVLGAANDLLGGRILRRLRKRFKIRD
jgi:uncharacterized membrane protein YkvA (DUF1232 family)